MSTPNSAANLLSCERRPRLIRRSLNDYHIFDVIGRGASCIVYQLVPKTPTQRELVMKVASGEPENDDLIRHEWEIGYRLSGCIHREQLPIIFHSATTTFRGRSCILMEVGRMNAKQFLLHPGPKTLIERVSGMVPQLIQRLEQFHDLGYIHRDVKLANFLHVFSASQKDYVFKLADLGLAMRYLDEEGRHIANGKSSYLGTPSFSSKNADTGNVQSRRDDMESLAYSLINVALQRPLPWESKPLDEVRTIKAETSTLDLCQGLPRVFADFLTYCSQLEFEERPDYRTWGEEFAKLGEVDNQEFPVTESPPSGLEQSSNCAATSDRKLTASVDTPEGEKTPSCHVERGRVACTPPRTEPRCDNPARQQSKGWAGPSILPEPRTKACPTLRSITNVASAQLTSAPNTPHFAKPTVAYLARQKVPSQCVRKSVAQESVAR